MRTAHCTSTSLILFAFLGGCEGGNARVGEKVEQIADRCSRFPISVEPADSVAPNARCGLIDQAFFAIKSAPSTSHIDPADTAGVTAILITPVAEYTPDGNVVRATWHVTLQLKTKPYDIDVVIDRSTGKSVVERVHKG
jgi:hypothetical protein